MTTNKPPNLPLRRSDTGSDGLRSPATTPKPPLPPRLPPRQPSQSRSSSVSSDIRGPSGTTRAHEVGDLNLEAIDRLGKAGVSVPALNIGARSPPAVPSGRPIASSSKSPAESNASSRSGLERSFSQLSTRTSTPASSSKGTSFAEKQAALRTATSFRKDPSSVSLSEGMSAARTANNFRERHGEKAAQGLTHANKLNQEYGIVKQTTSYSESTSPPDQVQARQGIPAMVTKKKPPPPLPPPKKMSVSPDVAASAVPPPPVPIATKPR